MTVNEIVRIGTETEFSTIADLALNVLLPFNTTYLCEVTFSALTHIKSQYRSALKNVEEVLRPAVSNIPPRFYLLCNKNRHIHLIKCFRTNSKLIYFHMYMYIVT